MTKPKPLDLEELNKLADEIIEMFCVVDDIPYPDGTGIWGKDTEIYSTDENGTARSKARKDVIREVRQCLKSALQGLLNDIEEQKGLIKICNVCKSNNKIENVIIIDTLKQLIRKWFPDVVKDD